MSNNCPPHSLITSDLSAFVGPRFLSVSLMMWILFFFRNQFVKCPFFFSTQIGIRIKCSNFLNVNLRLASLHLVINFEPGDSTRIVAIFGLNDFESLCTPTGTI